MRARQQSEALPVFVLLGSRFAVSYLCRLFRACSSSPPLYPTARRSTYALSVCVGFVLPLQASIEEMVRERARQDKEVKRLRALLQQRTSGGGGGGGSLETLSLEDMEVASPCSRVEGGGRGEEAERLRQKVALLEEALVQSSELQRKKQLESQQHIDSLQKRIEYYEDFLVSGFFLPRVPLLFSQCRRQKTREQEGFLSSSRYSEERYGHMWKGVPRAGRRERGRRGV